MVPSDPDPGDLPTLLSEDETIEFWDARHTSQGTSVVWRSTSRLPATRQMSLLRLRLGRMIDILGDLSSDSAPLRMLDAGCGKGYFTRAMASLDTASTALTRATTRSSTAGSSRSVMIPYAVSTLAAWRPPYLYDAVFSVDVLFHVMDDDLWESSFAT